MKTKYAWLIVIFENKHLKEMARIFCENGFNCWSGQTIGETHIAHLCDSQAKINKVGCGIIGHKAAFPWLKNVRLIDEKGLI